MNWLIEFKPGINNLGLSSRIFIYVTVLLDKILHSHSVAIWPIGMSGLTARGNPAME